jgi:hypothetical protein
MWYPNRAQWWVIWSIAALFSLLGLFAAFGREPGLLLIMVLVDGALLVWRLQR